LAKNAELEMLKQELMVSGGDFDAVQNVDRQEMKDQGLSEEEAQFKSTKMKGRDVSHLQKSVLDKLAYLDEDSDDDFGDDLDDMFNPTVGADYEKELEAELNSAFKASKKGGAAKLLKEAVGVEYVEESKEGGFDLEEMEAELKDTLNIGAMEIDDIGAQNQLMAVMTEGAVVVDFEQMPQEEVVRHVETTWKEIETMKTNQKELKLAQENVVGHLVETNEWLFAALQETLNQSNAVV